MRVGKNLKLAIPINTIINASATPPIPSPNSYKEGT
jgi:hypothetical protein